jgi:hypothetical protein
MLRISERIKEPLVRELDIRHLAWKDMTENIVAFLRLMFLH